MHRKSHLYVSQSLKSIHRNAIAHDSFRFSLTHKSCTQTTQFYSVIWTTRLGWHTKRSHQPLYAFTDFILVVYSLFILHDMKFSSKFTKFFWVWESRCVKLDHWRNLWGLHFRRQRTTSKLQDWRFAGIDALCLLFCSMIHPDNHISPRITRPWDGNWWVICSYCHWKTNQTKPNQTTLINKNIEQWRWLNCMHLHSILPLALHVSGNLPREQVAVNPMPHISESLSWYFAQTDFTAEQIASQMSVEDCSTYFPSFQICIGLLAQPKSLPSPSNTPDNQDLKLSSFRYHND